MRTAPGADQPLPALFRHETYPFPYLPPTTNAAVFSSGTITMQYAFSSSSAGMPLSGVLMISDSTADASFRRLVGSLSSARRDTTANIATTVATVSLVACRRAVAFVILPHFHLIHRRFPPGTNQRKAGG